MAGAAPEKRWLDIGFWLPRRIEHPRFCKIQTIYPKPRVHLLRLTSPELLDEQVAAWLKEAYAVGCQEHVARRERQP